MRIETQADLTIRDSGSESDLQVGSGANITLLAGRDIGLGTDVIVIAIEGTVTLTADTTPGNNGGSINMHDRSLIDAGIGRIRLTADGNITIGGVKTNNGSGTAVELSTSSGTVVDGGDHFPDVDTNGRVTVNTAVSPDPSKGAFHFSSMRRLAGKAEFKLKDTSTGVWGLKVFELEGRFSFKRPVNEWVNELN